MQLLVTGGAGFIGSRLVARLLDQGYQVRVLDNLSSGDIDRLPPQAELVKGDIRDVPLLDQALDGVTLVFHLAAMVSVIQSVQQPLEAQSINATGTLQLLEAARRAGVRRVVQASTCAIYGDNSDLPLSESAAPRPLSPYALTKLAAEQAGQLYHSLYNLEVVALRFFNVYGPGQNPNSDYAAAIPRFLQQLRAGQTVTIFGDGLQSRDFVFLDDIVQALWVAGTANNVAGEVFNVASGEAHAIIDVAENLADALQVKPELRFAPARAGEIRHSLGDPSRFRNQTGFLPQTRLVEGLARTVAES